MADFQNVPSRPGPSNRGMTHTAGWEPSLPEGTRHLPGQYRVEAIQKTHSWHTSPWKVCMVNQEDPFVHSPPTASRLLVDFVSPRTYATPENFVNMHNSNSYQRLPGWASTRTFQPEDPAHRAAFQIPSKEVMPIHDRKGNDLIQPFVQSITFKY
jgi:hypothetical protein